MMFVSRIFSVTILLFLFFPLIIKILGVENGPLVELPTYERRIYKTKLPEFKKLKLTEISREIESWANDSIPCRKIFLDNYSRIWPNNLKSTHTARILGKDGDYFLTRLVSSYLGVNQLSDEVKENIVLTYAGTQAFFEQKNIKYLVTLIPDKPTVYSANLPGKIGKLKSYPKIDQVYESLVEKNINVFSFKQSLLKKTNHYRTYNRRHDLGHWNAYGLECGYDEIREKLGFQNVNNYPFENKFKIQSAEPLCEERVPIMIHKDMSILKLNNELIIDFDEIIGARNSNLVFNKTVNNNCLVLLCDSFFRTTHQEHPQGANGAIFPFAYDVNRFFVTHYRKIESMKALEWIRDQIKPTFVVESIVEFAFLDNGDRFKNSDLLDLGRKVLYQKNINDIVFSLLAKDGVKIKNLDIAKKTNNTLIINARNNDPYLILPNTYSSENGEFMFACTLNAPEDTISVMHYAREGDKFTKENKVFTKIKKGKNDIFFRIKLDSKTKLQIRFDPGSVKGIYEISPWIPPKKMINDNIANKKIGEKLFEI